MKDHHAPARRFIDAGVPVAIGTDFNPGTSPTASLPLAMTVACLNLGLTPDEVLAAVTINAAAALRLEDEIGSLEAGKAADMVIWGVPTSTQIVTWPGADLVRTVIKRGRVVVDRPALTAGADSRAGVRPACRATPAGRSSSPVGRLRRRDRQLGLGDRLGAHLVEELARTSAQSASSSQSGIGTTIRGSSWATAPRRWSG